LLIAGTAVVVINVVILAVFLLSLASLVVLTSVFNSFILCKVH
jgi:hypothetical protein